MHTFLGVRKYKENTLIYKERKQDWKTELENIEDFSLFALYLSTQKTITERDEISKDYIISCLRNEGAKTG